jgi:hypothetical protein
VADGLAFANEALNGGTGGYIYIKTYNVNANNTIDTGVLITSNG